MSQGTAYIQISHLGSPRTCSDPVMHRRKTNKIRSISLFSIAFHSVMISPFLALGSKPTDGYPRLLVTCP